MHTINKTPKDVFVEMRIRHHGETRDQAIKLFNVIVNRPEHIHLNEIRHLSIQTLRDAA